MTHPMEPALTSRHFSTARHTTSYLEAGPPDGTLMMFLHGWPSIALMWRDQMSAFAADGWRCIAPDLRGFGGSSVPAATDAYTIEKIVSDMAELHDHLGGKPAIWVGHDWGCVVVGALVAHQSWRSRGVVLTSLAYQPDGHALPTIVPLVDRTIYPVDQYPDGQWDYYRYYTKHFEAAVADLDADKAASLASIFGPGDPAAIGQVAPLAVVTRNGGRFGAAHRAPPTRPDPALWPPADFDRLVQAFEAHGFGPPCAWYLNDDAALAYARAAPDGGRISQPILFVNGDFDQVCTIDGNRQGDPMRAACADLTVTSLPAGHWLPLERKAELTDAMRTWLQSKGLSPLAPGKRTMSTLKTTLIETRHVLSDEERQIEHTVLAAIHHLFENPPGDQRVTYDALIVQTPIADGVTLEPVDRDGARGWWVRPAAAPADRAILYLHGGAYMLGSAKAYRGLASQVAIRAGVAAFVADYPLAPEHVFPAAPDAAVDTRRWLGGQGVSQVALVGDSAGGALALDVLGDLSTTMPAIASVAMFSPWVDLAMTGASFTDPAIHDPIFFKPEMLAGPAASYLGGADPRDGRASPLFAVPETLPPLLIQVGGDEKLLDDARRYAEAAASRGGEVRLDVFEGLHHVFQGATKDLPTARKALDSVAAFLRRHWA